MYSPLHFLPPKKVSKVMLFVRLSVLSCLFFYLKVLFYVQSFWIENQTKKQQSNCYIPPDGDFVPLYDRGFALGLSSIDGPSNVEG